VPSIPETAVAVPWDPRPAVDDDHPDVGALRTELWVRLGVDVGPTRALAIGSELTSRGEGGMNPGPYAAQAIARMPLGQLAAIADVEGAATRRAHCKGP
jgi:hypothetical protein